ncbi:hypothetical protein [Sphingomonas sp. Y38-1Y]|uniref:hypothetical protein n=1 Tax=Sphingomonas sp. Y38-1Y TaxID=3078265 RepID=UPI0028E849AA|nr:hypothetical protein [Sphingomonas sp. Y38-1Y]
MHRHFFSLRIAALVILAGIAVASIDLWLGGFTVVADPDRQLAGAAIRDARGERPMRGVAEGFWAARPRMDGRVVMRCANGAVLDGAYVTPGGRVRETVAPGACAAARPAR